MQVQAPAWAASHAGDLHSKMSKNHVLSEKEAAGMVQAICSVVQLCESEGDRRKRVMQYTRNVCELVSQLRMLILARLSTGK